MPFTLRPIYRAFPRAVPCNYDPYSGGENISSIEVETVLHQHESVSHVAVVAMPDRFWGEVPVAVVETKPGVEVMRLAAAFYYFTVMDTSGVEFHSNTSTDTQLCIVF